MKTRSIIFAAVAAFALVLSACAPAASPATRTVSVSGSGTAYLVPDIAYIYVGVHTEKLTASEAVAENTHQTQQMIQALTEFGIDPKDIRTTNFSIWPQDKYDPMTGTPTGEKVYSVDNTVYVTIRDINKLGDLLDTVVAAGANTVNSIQFDVADKTAAMKEARDAAVKNAQEQAQELASAAGVSLGDITNISFYDTAPYPVYGSYGKGGGGGSDAAIAVPIQPGEMTIVVSVSLTYEIK